MRSLRRFGLRPHRFLFVLLGLVGSSLSLAEAQNTLEVYPFRSAQNAARLLGAIESNRLFGSQLSEEENAKLGKALLRLDAVLQEWVEAYRGVVTSDRRPFDFFSEILNLIRPYANEYRANHVLSRISPEESKVFMAWIEAFLTQLQNGQDGVARCLEALNVSIQRLNAMPNHFGERVGDPDFLLPSVTLSRLQTLSTSSTSNSDLNRLHEARGNLRSWNELDSNRVLSELKACMERLVGGIAANPHIDSEADELTLSLGVGPLFIDFAIGLAKHKLGWRPYWRTNLVGASTRSFGLTAHLQVARYQAPIPGMIAPRGMILGSSHQGDVFEIFGPIASLEGTHWDEKPWMKRWGVGTPLNYVQTDELMNGSHHGLLKGWPTSFPRPIAFTYFKLHRRLSALVQAAGQVPDCELGWLTVSLDATIQEMVEALKADGVKVPEDWRSLWPVPEPFKSMGDLTKIPKPRSGLLGSCARVLHLLRFGI